jgi:PAS domain S-box-containing protein
MAQDITHRKETEKALIESEKKYRDLIEFAVDGILIGDADGNIIGANSCMQKLTGRALEQLIGLNVRNLFSDETLAGTPLRYDLLNKGETVTCERELLRLDGTRVPIEMHTKKMPDGTYQSFYRDITERLKAEESLRQSELKFKSLVESTSDMIWETNIQGKYTYVSPQFEKLLGYKPEEVVGTSPFSYIRNDNMPAIINQSDAIVAQGVAFSSLVNKYIHQDGSILYFETSGVPVTDVHGRLSGYRGISRDITKRYKAEIELHKLSWIVQQSPISILLTDLDGNIEYANDAVSHASGYSLEEIYGKNPSIFKSNQTSESDYKVLWENLLAGNKWAGTFLSKRKDGSLYWESAVIQPVKDANGIITNYLGIKEDITKRVNAEHALTESEKRYRGLFEASPDAILLADTETGMLIDANSTACLMLGYSHEQIRTLHQSQVHPERLHLESRQLFKTHTQKPSIQTPTESIIVKSDGTKIPVEILSSINVIDGRNVLMGVFRDITERNQAREDILRAKEKAEASDKLKSAFLNNISHELRTPLNGIIGFSEMITQMDSTEEDKVEFSKMIRKSSVRLINTITSYMDISMLASGIVETISRKVNLKKLINRVYEQTVETSQLRNQPVKINTEGNTAGVEIISDENLLFKVLTYLVDNALKFTKEGSITIGYERIDNNHHFSVTDTGIGIAPESLSLIFDIFTQADISTSRGYEGSGLGLSIAKGFIERLGGKIYVKSAPGLGSTFWFTIPDQIDSKAVASISNLKHNESGANKNIILVAEDDDSNYKYIEIILKKASYKVLRATNGFETVETCRSHPEISLLITDLKMPGMDGFEATRKIRQLRPELPIVVISAFASKSDEEAACNAGCNEYIVKPVTKSKLLDTLQSFLKED